MPRWFIASMMLGLLSNVWGMIVEGAPVTVQVTLPADMEQTDRPLVLHIENLQLPPQASGIVRIFADLPQANADTSTEDEHFLGYFTILAKTSTEAAQGVQRHDAVQQRRRGRLRHLARHIDGTKRRHVGDARPAQ